RSEEVAGTSRTFVDRQDMLEHVATLRPPHATDQAADARRAVKAIESLNRAGLLVGPSTTDRFEVSPVIDVVLPLERLQDLLRWLRTQNSPGERAAAVVGVVDRDSSTGRDSDHDASDEDEDER